MVKSDCESRAINIPAPDIAGIANKNENLAEFLPDIPRANPVQIVIPDREIPGIIAIAWVIPVSYTHLTLPTKRIV